MYLLLSGHSNDAPTKEYTVKGSKENRIFGTFNAISIIATTFASGIIPEIQVLFSSLSSLMRDDERKLGKRSTITYKNCQILQATIAPPVQGKMFKGLCVCYSVITLTYSSVGISGYWAFGNQSKGTILSNFMGVDKPLLATWFLLMTNVFTLLQVLAVTVVRPIS